MHLLPGHLVPWTFQSTCPVPFQAEKAKNKLLYFEWSPPWHVGWRLSGEGCHWEYDGKNGEFENIDFRFPWLSDTSEMGFGHGCSFLELLRQAAASIELNVSLIGSGEGRHTTHLLKCVSVTFNFADWLEAIFWRIFLTYLLTFFLTNLLIYLLTFFLTFFLTSFWHIFWHSFWQIFWRSFWHIFWHSFWHIFRHAFWHIFWHSFWHIKTKT